MKWLSASHSFHFGFKERAEAPARQERVWTAESAWMRWRTKTFPPLSGIERLWLTPLSSPCTGRATQIYWHYEVAGRV